MSTVLVTGVTGFIGLHCVHQLIQAGHHVHGTLRSKSREHEVRESLKRANLADGNLVLFECDLLGDSGWNDAVRGLRLHPSCGLTHSFPAFLTTRTISSSPLWQELKKVLEACSPSGVCEEGRAHLFLCGGGRHL